MEKTCDWCGAGGKWLADDYIERSPIVLNYAFFRALHKKFEDSREKGGK